MADPDRCPWDTLPAELVMRIAHTFSPNEAACTLRRINKFLAKLLQGCTTVRLSQPVPHHAFVRRWGDDRGVHGLTFKQRQQLICLTARSGVIANLEVAVAVAGCPLTEQMFNAAATGGHLVVYVWLLDRGGVAKPLDAIRCAARGGHTDMVRWLLEEFPEYGDTAAYEAAGAGQRALCDELLIRPVLDLDGLEWAVGRAVGGGHVELTEWLLGLGVKPFDVSDTEMVLGCAAHGFELSALQRLYHSHLSSKASAKFIEAHGDDFAAAALASSTPDWRAKLEWLEALGCRLGQDQSWDDITKRGDAVERVELLQERGLLDVYQCLIHAVDNANLSVVRYLRSEELLTDALGDSVMEASMALGDVAILAELVAAGGTVELEGVCVAARRGHLHVLRWLEGPEAGPAAAAVLQGALQEVELAEEGAKSGSLELMEWLWERGCPSDEARVFMEAMEAGNGAVLERLAARGCPMSCDAYLEAGYNGDLATLRCLRRLDCPWGPDTFDEAVHMYGRGCSLAVLRWLVAEGCPVDWESARGKAHKLSGREAADVVAWITSHIPEA